MKIQNFYLLIDLEKAFRQWRASGRRNTFGDYCRTLEFLGVKILCLVVLWAGFCGSAMADVHIDMAKIAQIESSGNPLAYNRASGARGLYQVTPICLEDYNARHKARITLEGLFKASNSYKVASWYFNHRIPQLLAHYGLMDTVKNRLWAYNAGIGMVKRGILPAETKDYIKKYLKRG